MKRLHEDFLDDVEQQELTAPKEVIKKNIQDYEWRIPIVCRDTLDVKVQRLADVTTGLKDYAIEMGSDFVEFQFAFNADFKTVTQAVTFVKTLTTLLSRAFGDFNLIFYRQNSDYSNIVFKTEVLDDIFNQNRTSYGYYDNEYKKLMSLLMGLLNYKKDVQVVEYVQEMFELSKNLIYTYQPSTLTQFSIDVRREIRDLPVHFDVMPETARLIALNCLEAYTDYREHRSSGQAMSFKYTDETLYNALSGKPAKQTMVSFSVRKGYLWYTAYLGVCAWGPEYYLNFLEFNCPDVKSYIKALEGMYQTKLSKQLKQLIKNEYEAARIGINDDCEL